MFDRLKDVLGVGNEEQAPERVLASPEQLDVGDIVKFQFMDQPELSGKQFQVAGIITYDFEHGSYPQFALKGENNELIYLSVHNEDGKQFLAISKKITRGDVEGMFDLDIFAGVFEEGALTIEAAPYAPLKDWLAGSYYKAVDCRRGYRHIGDYRNQPLPEFEDDSEGIDYYLLKDNSDKFAVEIEVGDEDESAVYVTVYQPISVISEMWPAA